MLGKPALRRTLQLMCSMLMYEHRHPSKRVEVVDLDPYGTAAPFIDGAVQCVTDGGEVLGVFSLPELTLRSTGSDMYRSGGPCWTSIPREMVSSTYPLIQS